MKWAEGLWRLLPPLAVFFLSLMTSEVVLVSMEDWTLQAGASGPDLIDICGTAFETREAA